MTKTKPKETEAGFTRAVIDLARLHGWKVAHFRPARVRRGGKEIYETPVAGDGKGWPDLFLVRGSWCLAAELKVGKNKVTAEQREWLLRLGGAGVEVRIWRPEDWDEIVAFLT